MTSARYILLARGRQHFRTIRPIDDSRVAREKRESSRNVRPPASGARKARFLRLPSVSLAAALFASVAHTSTHDHGAKLFGSNGRTCLVIRFDSGYAGTTQCVWLQGRETVNKVALLIMRALAPKNMRAAACRSLAFVILFSGAQLQKEHLSSLFESSGYTLSYNL